ncbi:DNA-directed RNA polymerase I subunit RPA43 isoform X2 [Drosophila kikkawai]|uniref:DNA-directed RNA polymerase I subunit RPA43 isoform X2 n=1 Tax=Drosophila kikkawai TaxID=30033 RepID=A0ABM4G9Y2_DROKI
MAKILQKYIKFSGKELEKYASNPDSCVRCLNTDMHLAMGPYGMASFKHALHELLIRTKVGIYDSGLDGIVLGIKNIKMLGHTAALRADDPTMHLVINADFYVFRPVIGAILDGVVRHISKHQVSAIIYRVFNTTIRFTNKKHSRESMAMEQEIKFRIKNFDISNAMPYIEGELQLEDGEEPQNKSIKFGSPEPEEKEEEIKKEDPDDMLDALLESLKEEPDEVQTSKKKSSSKRSKKASENAIEFLLF